MALLASVGRTVQTPADIDSLVESTGLTASQVLSTLGVLDMRRIIRRLPGNRGARA